ncbi:TonB-dependent receptor, partial [Sphingomonas immobilis]
MRRSSVLLTLLLGGLPVAALAQAAPPSPQQTAPEDDETGGEVVVRGQKLPGSVQGDIPPELTLSPADIRSYGVNSISDLLTELAPQTRSDRGSGGAPVVLLDGKRISSFAEIRDIPTEAIQRAEILPEEVALKYGYRADQRVVNIVLRRRFRALTTELTDTLPTAGGSNTPQVEVDVLKIGKGTRANLHLSYKDTAALTEDERGIVQPPSNFAIGGNVIVPNGDGTSSVLGVPASAATTRPALGNFATAANTSGLGAYRTLIPSSNDFVANAVYATSIGKASASFNGRIEATSSQSLQGLPTVALSLPAGNPYSPFASNVTLDRALRDGFLPLSQKNSSVIGHLGATFNGALGKWQWSFIGTFDRTDSETFTDTGIDAATFQSRLNAGDPTANPYGPLAGLVGSSPVNQAYSTAQTLAGDGLLSGALFKLPAGDVSTSIKIGAQTNSFDSRSVRNLVDVRGNVGRDIASGQINIDVPLTSRSKQVLGAIGTLSANFNYAVDRLSDFGTLTTLGYGINWAPIPALRILASATDRDDAPTPQQLGNPQITTANVRVFDYVNGTTANVTTISGGNPSLKASSAHTRKLEATLKPWASKDISFSANYVDVRTENPTVSFPGATAAIAAVFPNRFTRDAAGNLTRVDLTPINFAETSRSELRWGVNFSVPLKSKIQKEFEAFRAGKGPNPLEGLFPNGRGPGAGGPGGPGGGGEGARGVGAGGDAAAGRGRRGGGGAGGRGRGRGRGGC